MSTEVTPLHGVMEGGGNYNQHARIQASGGSLALPLLERIVQEINIGENDDEPIVIADYGSSQGRNSLAPMRVAIRALRARVGPGRAIRVTHIDQPANDFNTLFELLHRDPDRYSLDDPNVFPGAIGRSFYEQVLPLDSVHLGWSAYAAMWLSRVPTLITGHFRTNRGTAVERAAFQQQAAQDWESFLALRGRELRPGGRFLLVLAGMNDEGQTGYEDLMDEANELLAEMVSQGVLRAEERARMIVPTCLRRRRELLAPFDRDGQFQGLTVASCDVLPLNDPTWTAYERDGNKEGLASRRAKLFRATFAPSLACGLSNPAASDAFAENLEKGLARRLTNKSVPINAFVQVMVLAKQESKAETIRIGAAANRNGQKAETASTLGGLLHSRAQETPDATALLCGDRKMCYGELDESSTRLAAWLLERGLQQGDRVAIHWCNSIETVQLFFAIFKAGLIAVPINLRLKPPEAAWILQHSRAVLCFSEPALAPIAEEARAGCPSLQPILTQLPALGTGSSSPLPQVESDQPAVILYTSGSTARPKGATHSHRTLMAAARMLAENLLRSDDVVLIMTQMMHAVGLNAVLLPATYRGIPAVLLPAFEPGPFLDTVERFRCTYTAGLPTLMQMVADEQARKPRDTSSLRTVVAGGDSVPHSLQERFASLLGVPLQEVIGMSETIGIALNPKGAIRPGSCGLALPGVQVAVVNADGKHLPDGEVGELVVRSPACCLGYWNDPAATEELLRGGWLHSGDLAMRDADGYLWFKGRKKEIIVRGGSNISPQEVEEVIYQHPDVFEVGVIGAPDPHYGERVVAFVSLRNGHAPSEEALREYARKSLADYKVPEKIFFVPQLPKGTTGKVHRATLKAMLLEMKP
jgi:long-chain acyl-CoA synthetase